MARVKKAPSVRVRTKSRATAAGQCLCGTVELEIDVPVFWAWHDHSQASRLAHGAVYATYVGAWRSKMRIIRGEARIARFEDQASGASRSFCSRCGSPLIYESGRSSKMVNLPRALFADRTGREARYHIAIDQLQDWAYGGQPLVPLKGFPGVMQERPRKKRTAAASLY